MQVKCSLCGGENELHPGQQMLFCVYCGSSLAIGGGEKSEHLILPHKRNDRIAEEALRSFLAGRGLARPREIETGFSYIPYTTGEDDKGRPVLLPASREADPTGVLAFPPAGNYRYFDEEAAGKETIVQPGGEIPRGVKMLHLPVYEISYRAGGGRWKAAVMGESLFVYADEFPPAQTAPLSATNMLAASCLFVLYLFAGRLGHGWAGRLLVTSAAAALGFVGFTIRRRIFDGRR